MKQCKYRKLSNGKNIALLRNIVSSDNPDLTLYFCICSKSAANSSTRQHLSGMVGKIFGMCLVEIFVWSPLFALRIIVCAHMHVSAYCMCETEV